MKGDLVTIRCAICVSLKGKSLGLGVYRSTQLSLVYSCGRTVVWMTGAQPDLEASVAKSAKCSVGVPTGGSDSLVNVKRRIPHGSWRWNSAQCGNDYASGT